MTENSAPDFQRTYRFQGRSVVLRAQWEAPDGHLRVRWQTVDATLSSEGENSWKTFIATAEPAKDKHTPFIAHPRKDGRGSWQASFTLSGLPIAGGPAAFVWRSELRDFATSEEAFDWLALQAQERGYNRDDIEWA